jgi:hypothetical protein
MKRAVVATAIFCLGAMPALAAAPKIEAAVKTFKAVGADAGKLKTFCEMSKTMESAGEKEDKALEAKIAGYMKQLGPDFESAWNAGDGVDENSADGKLLFAAMDDLQNKCP